MVFSLHGEASFFGHLIEIILVQQKGKMQISVDTHYLNSSIVKRGKWLRNLAKFFAVYFCWLFLGWPCTQLGKIQYKS